VPLDENDKADTFPEASIEAAVLFTHAVPFHTSGWPEVGDDAETSPNDASFPAPTTTEDVPFPTYVF
jgi:hypothetical protein